MTRASLMEGLRIRNELQPVAPQSCAEATIHTRSGPHRGPARRIAGPRRGSGRRAGVATTGPGPAPRAVVRPTFQNANQCPLPATSGAMNGLASSAPCFSSVSVKNRIGEGQQQDQEDDAQPVRVMPVDGHQMVFAVAPRMPSPARPVTEPDRTKGTAAPLVTTAPFVVFWGCDPGVLRCEVASSDRGS